LSVVRLPSDGRSAVQAPLPRQDGSQRDIGHGCRCPTYGQRVKLSSATGEPEHVVPRTARRCGGRRHALGRSRHSTLSAGELRTWGRTAGLTCVGCDWSGTRPETPAQKPAHNWPPQKGARVNRESCILRKGSVQFEGARWENLLVARRAQASHLDSTLTTPSC
jgi:hypothetical protein